MLKVCFLHDNFWRSSGSATAIQRIFEHCLQGKIEPYFVGCNRFENFIAPQEENTAWMPANSFHVFELFRNDAFLLPALTRFATWLRNVNCDLIHVHHRRLAALAHSISPLTGVPVLYTGHNTFPYARWFWAGCPPMATGVSRSVVDYLESSTRARSVELIYNPMPFPEAIPQRSAALQRRAVCVARLEPIKGHLILLQAWKKLLDRGLAARLDLFGEGKLRQPLQEFVLANGLESLVRFQGFSPEVATALAQSDFNILVSEGEGFPNVVVEAGLQAIPTLLTDVDGNRDACPSSLRLPNRLPFGDADALTDALEQWFAHGEARVLDGRSFFEHLRTLCSVDVVTKQYLDVYHRTAKRR